MDNIASPDWSLVQAFLAVAETGSLSAAARKLRASQPTVGRQVHALEAQLGTELFHRQPRGMALTETGAALLGPAREMRAAAHRMALRAGAAEAALEGTVRISASVAMSVLHLPAILARIRQEEPRISLELVVSDTSTNLLFREADIALRMFRPTQLDLVARHVGDMEIGAFAAKSYLERRGTPQSAQELLHHDCIGFDANPLILEGFRAAGFAVTREFFALRCDDQAAYWQMLRAGCGIGFGQVAAARDEPGLQELDLGLDLPRLPLWLAAPDVLRQTPRIRRVWDLLGMALEPLCQSR